MRNLNFAIFIVDHKFHRTHTHTHKCKTEENDLGHCKSLIIIFLLRGLRVMDTFSKSDPMCVLYRKVRNIIFLSLLMFVNEKKEFHALRIQDKWNRIGLRGGEIMALQEF